MSKHKSLTERAVEAQREAYVAPLPEGYCVQTWTPSVYSRRASLPNRQLAA